MLAPLILALLPLLPTSHAAPVNERSAAPSVTLTNGTVVGSAAAGIDSFLGIPYALPPTGSLRLKPPQTYNQTYPGGTFSATSEPTACPQLITTIDVGDTGISPLAGLAGELLNSTQLAAIDNTGEDCLTINVQRPTGTAADAALPVIFWIFGGGFEFGSTSQWDATDFLLEGVDGSAAGHPLIHVSVNYRVNGFGFLAGAELQADGSTNLGLRDQRLGLEWVAENVAAFGGDPSKVTLWGESAGAISVLDQTVINGGDNTYNGSALFRAAIMDSGSVIPAEPVNTGKAQAVYDQVVSAAGCSSAADTLACLRDVDYGTFYYAVISVPGIFSYSSLDLSYLPRPDPNSIFFATSPDAAIAAGAYAHVPIINGDQRDEGTLFSLVQSNISTTAELVAYLQSYFPVEGAALVPGLVALYPDDASAGSPFGTADLYNFYPQFKRLAAILGDITFTLRRRLYLADVCPAVDCWSYLDNHLYLLVPYLGTFHATDVLESYYDLPDLLTGNEYQAYYTSFAYYLDPNTIQAGLLEWPQWTSAEPNLLELNLLINDIIQDDFREAAYEYLAENAGGLKV